MTLTDPIHPAPSYPAHARYLVRRGLSVLPRLLPNTGSPAFAGDDGRECGPLRSIEYTDPIFENQLYVRLLAARIAPEVCMNVVPRHQREQGMPGARCTRGLVCKSAQRKAHTSIQVQRKHSGIPCAMALRLMPRSPRRRIRLVAVAAGLMADRSGRNRCRHRQLGTSNGCRDHTVLPYATNAVRPARRCSLTEDRPANTFARPTLSRPPHPTPRS
jgi:hypothetical protein